MIDTATLPEALLQAARRRFGRDYDPADETHTAFAEGWQSAVDQRWSNPAAAEHANLIDRASEIEHSGGENAALVVDLANAFQQMELLMLARLRNLQALDDWGIATHGERDWDGILRTLHVDILRDEDDSLPKLTATAASIARDLRAHSARIGTNPAVESAIRWIERCAVPIDAYATATAERDKAEADLSALRRSESTLIRRLVERAASLNLAHTGTLASAVHHAERWMDHVEDERDDLRATIVELHDARAKGLPAIERILDQGPAPRTEAVRGGLPVNAPAIAWTDSAGTPHIAMREGNPLLDDWLLDGKPVVGDDIRELIAPATVVRALRWAP